jgi:hypothetical protein
VERVWEDASDWVGVGKVDYSVDRPDWGLHTLENGLGRRVVGLDPGIGVGGSGIVVAVAVVVVGDRKAVVAAEEAVDTPVADIPVVQLQEVDIQVVVAAAAVAAVVQLRIPHTRVRPEQHSLVVGIEDQPVGRSGVEVEVDQLHIPGMLELGLGLGVERVVEGLDPQRAVGYVEPLLHSRSLRKGWMLYPLDPVPGVRAGKDRQRS